MVLQANDAIVKYNVGSGPRSSTLGVCVFGLAAQPYRNFFATVGLGVSEFAYRIFA